MFAGYSTVVRNEAVIDKSVHFTLSNLRILRRAIKAGSSYIFSQNLFGERARGIQSADNIGES
jgi:hypothetical protein